MKRRIEFISFTSSIFFFCYWSSLVCGCYCSSLVCGGAPSSHPDPANGCAGSRRSQLPNALALTPPMGWNSWNHFHCNINETIIRQTADALVSTGLAKLGYQYVNIDDCWAESKRDSKGNLVANKITFPSGIKALADYVHDKGLKLGIYEDSGFRTCGGGMPGSLHYEEQDARTFASWGIDYLKYDNCYNDDTRPTIRYPIMSRALVKTGRPIIFSMCEWGDMRPALWARNISNSWRTTDDISDSWGSMLNIADMNEIYADYAGPGGWNDPDMLEVGNGGMHYKEYKVHFSLWAISKAPLILGCDVRFLTDETMQIIGNEEVISVNQDKLGVQAKKVRNSGERQTWAGRLTANRIVILLVNRKPYVSTMTAHWDDIGIQDDNVVVQARDLWEHRTLETTFQGKLTAKVDPHSCKMYVLTPVS
ncbi:alpha-galactosidase-like [Malania oleifera]|uniref:alpha-galactosidase-like n=1 Tax=Malania oleifera TaxID=397392 RepID=UPI0025ADCE65|nr:alpha-galactosidase-like [Malania oleifera]